MKSALTLPAYGMAALLALVLVWEWLPSSDADIPVPAVALHARNHAAEPDSVAKDTQAWAHAIVTRPLFNIGRKPPKTVAGHGPVSVNGLPRLAGIMITQGGRRAIFMPAGGKPMTLGEGAAVDDYTIRRILPDHVVLASAKGDMVVRPAYDAAHSGGVTEMPPQPGLQPGFQVPPFNPGFRPPGMPPLPQMPQPGATSDDDDNSDAQPPSPPAQPQPFPGFRGPFIPRGRTQ